ncbi:MAG: TIGR02646 family protein, partial [Desulfobulbaceae bacterium]|nr:TIGR02646 family protein [Desulfobulbaceae bacterium]
MRTIQRNAEPECLAQQPKHQSWKDFAGTPCYVYTRNSLKTEQEGLCGYCESLVGDGDGHVEHMEPRSRNPERTYDYKNLVFSCNGGGNGQHCGHFKEASHDFEWVAEKFSSPHDPETCLLFSYDTDGYGFVSPTDHRPETAEYMIGYLNLNSPSLVSRRTHHGKLLEDTLGEQPDFDVITFLNEYFLNPDLNGHLKPFYSLSKA